MAREIKPDHLPIFRSPLVKEHNRQHVGQSRFERTPESDEQEHKIPRSDEASYETNDHVLHNTPAFRRHKAATNSELFYDLFFVANLTVFTTVHEVNDTTSFQQYMGFFAVLWFTWYQVGLYDIRFSMDSVFDRVAKAIQLGVMIGFAAVGPQFNVGTATHSKGSTSQPSYDAFQALTILLLVSRLVLVFQYLQIAFFTRHYKQTRLPLISITATYTAAAIVYGALYVTFTPNGGYSYIVWYVVAFMETVIATLISSIWRVISFKGTHLVERMSLLTLIILGEGIIGIAGKVQRFMASALFINSAAVIGTVISAVLILFFLYMLYFDWVEEGHFGTIRQQVWAFLHLPLHLALVAGLQGLAETISWTAATDTTTIVVYELIGYDISNSSSIAQMNNTVNALLYNAADTTNNYKALLSVIKSQMPITDGFDVLINQTASADDKEQARESIVMIIGSLIYKAAGFDPPHDDHSSADSSDYDTVEDELNSIYEVFNLVFVYTFVAIGLSVILIAVMAWLSKKEKRAIDYVRLGLNIFIGVAVCLLAIMGIKAESDELNAYDIYITSAWMLPTITLALFLAVVVNNLKLRCGGRREA